MKPQRKPKKLITLNERLLKDMYYIIPLSGAIFYLDIIQPYSAWKFNIIHTAESVNRFSLLLFILQIFYTLLCTSSLTQVITAYKSQLIRSNEKIRILHDFRIEYQPVSAAILYTAGFVRFFYFSNKYDVINYDQALFSISIIICAFMYLTITSKRRDIQRLISSNKDRFIN